MKTRSLWRNVAHLTLIIAIIIGANALNSTIGLGQETSTKQSANQELSGTENQSDSNETDAVTQVTESVPGNLDAIFAGNALPKTIGDLRAMQERVNEIANLVKSATVNIEVKGAQGSGIIISRDGLVLTAAHVISRPGQEAVVTTPDGKRFEAKTKGLAHGIDSGLVKIVEDGDWEYLDMGESTNLKQGQWVVAVGHPGGYEADRGLVVRLGRILNATTRVIQTDCTLVGGDSGGPLVDMSGSVIGIHSRIGATLSDNMHVPINIFSEGWDDLESDVESGRSVRRGVHLGFSLDDSDDLRLDAVEDDEAADKAGLLVGDIILEIDGKKIDSRRELRAAILKLEDKQEIKIKIEREGMELTLDLIVESR